MRIKMVMVSMISRLYRPSASISGIALLLGFAMATGACEKVPLLAPSGSSITMTASATALPTNGSTDIIAQVIESGGTPPHSGTLISFTTNLGSVQPGEAETDVSGKVRVKFVAGAGSGTATITAISGGVSASGTNAIKILIGSAGVGRVNMGASPTLVPTQGGTSVITAVVIDVNGNPLGNVPVSFSTTAGTLNDAVVNSDQNGVAQTTLRTAQTATVTASVGATATSGGGGGSTTPTTPTTGSVSGQASGTVTVGVSASPSLVITAPTTPPSVGLPATFTFAVTAATTNGSAVRDLTVNWGDGTIQDLGQVSGNATATHVFRSSGTYVITAAVLDASGNTTTVATSTTVIPVPRPTIIITPSPVPGKVNTQTNLQIQVTLPSGISVQDLTINFGDGQSADLGGATTANVPHVYTTAQTFTVTVTVL